MVIGAAGAGKSGRRRGSSIPKAEARKGATTAAANRQDDFSQGSGPHCQKNASGLICVFPFLPSPNS